MKDDWANSDPPNRRKVLRYLGVGALGAAAAAGIHYFNREPDAAQAKSGRTSSVNLSPAEVAQLSAANLPPARGILPEFQGIQQWLNSEPLTIAGLKGNVVMVQFWTFSCINCQRTLPYLVEWHQKYASQGLRIVGVQTPEFPFERDIGNIQNALEQAKITYPIAVDNDFKTWKAYQNQYWPHLFLGDRQGQLRYDHIGEGAYAETEALIQQLLAAGQ
ncbi:MAG: thioredoxin family protein [Drouetiella hepatica Uher 2000/2452]|jgi:thiol-disulfide isomerase/thioredoxin|uniref:Thioredoxin family protein n=1 Tax=Drouetiella hepatica Uher 2000/2452 TaxID=904376 RepID=A0A951QIB8_9CYAN|nr:thioredoxin family protein [Drouetiella hepatica Uher 2000/2452]